MKEFNFKKKFGQNFLIDENIINNIANSICPNENDLIVEIGPGIGYLTKKLLKYNSNYIGFEIDSETKSYLKIYENKKTRFIFNDFLKVDLKNTLSNINYQNLYIVGNLPYYITTPIIEKIIDSKLDLVSITIMVQKEVADRFLAPAGSKNYGYFTVILNYFFEIEKIIDVPRKCFNPSPKVDSTVIKLTKKENTDVLDYKKFQNFLKNAFKYKRKNLKNNLNGYNLKKIEDVLQKYNFDLTVRAEALNLKILIDLFKNL